MDKYKFRTQFGEGIFNTKYKNEEGGCATWPELSHGIAHRVCSPYLPEQVVSAIAMAITDMKFIPAGRYLYYAGREAAFFNNCLAFIAEDSREGWAGLGSQHFMALMSGGGCGTCYDNIRPAGSTINKTGGKASGPLSLMNAMNEIGRNVMQGGSRRSALLASLNWKHKDIQAFIHSKDWTDEQKIGKANDANYHAPLDMTNISVNLDDAWIEAMNDSNNIDHSLAQQVFDEVVNQMVRTAEPGFCFNFGDVSDQIGTNACAEYKTSYDSGVCNLGSVNMSRISSVEEMHRISTLGAMFLTCGSLMAELPYDKCYDVREKDRTIGLGLMGVHEFLLVNKQAYDVTPMLREYLEVWKDGSEMGAGYVHRKTGCTQVVRYRAIAPAGTISILAGTTSGIEPLFAVGLKRRYLKDNKWKYQYIIDPTAEYLIDECGVDPKDIETSMSLAKDPESRIKFQADVQDYVDMAISSTINLPAWGTPWNDPITLKTFKHTLLKYIPRLRGITCYPDGARGGQPLTAVPYEDAKAGSGMEHDELAEFLTTNSCPSGTCGI